MIEPARDSIIRTLLWAGDEVRQYAASDRASAASDRELAAADRAETSRTLLSAGGEVREFAAADRADAESDRRRAAVDRAQASTDRGEARSEFEDAQLDGLTGAHRRDLGLRALHREIDRARRSGEPFALAFVDVDGLKELNDREGHAAGDALLQTVVSAPKAHLRSYDPIVRVGGDEVLCGLTNTELQASRRRIEEIRVALQREATAASISVGLAVLDDRDTLES